jgi:PAS domain S-box-containing protein
MTGLQVSVAAFSVYVLSAVRAYVTGESLYSKGQKDAQIYLLDYADTHREADYQKLMQSLAVPIADRRAREQLQLPDPDIAIAHQAFIDGGNHPDDVAGLIRVFLWFGKTPLMAPAIATWTEGDRVIEQMRQLVERTRARVLAGEADADALKQIRAEAPELNRRLTRLERAFSDQLGEASRQTQTLLLVLNGLLAVLLAAFGIAFVRRTQRRQAMTEAEVARRQESLQVLLDSAAEGLFGVDVEGRCTFVNRAALRMLGYAHEAELLGSAIRQQIRASPEGVAQHSDAELYRRRDGSTFPVERWSHPMLSEGRVQGIVTTFFDISERLRLRSELRHEQILMQRLIGAVTDAVITFGEDMRINVFNSAAERLFLTPAQEALGSPLERFFDGALPFPHAAAEEPSGALYEVTGLRSDGSAFHLEASFSRVRTDETVLNTVVLRDITARELALAERRSREALEATNRAKSQFLSRMSHELRTPLNAVIGFAQLLRVDTSSPPTPLQLERIRHIERAGAHLLALVNDVLDLSRIESGDMAVTAEAVELGAVAEDAATMVSPLVTRMGVELFVSASPAPDHPQSRLFDMPLSPAAKQGTVWVSADPVRLRQVLVNLLSNAVKYNRHGGRVSLSWRVDGDLCEVSVTDNGPGISPSRLERLFEPFNRLGAESTNVEGTGIGLVLSRRLTEMMGGELRVTSRLDEGTVATVLLRNAEPGLRATAHPLLPSPYRSAASGLDVLYAEDNEVNAELVRQIVSMRPAVTLRIAQSGRDALAMARERPPQVMLVDMNLGDMTGLELARELRNGFDTGEIELIALSADALPEQIDTAIRNGFQDYLTKPVDFHQLLKVLDERLRTQ